MRSRSLIRNLLRISIGYKVQFKAIACLIHIDRCGVLVINHHTILFVPPPSEPGQRHTFSHHAIFHRNKESSQGRPPHHTGSRTSPCHKQSLSPDRVPVPLSFPFICRAHSSHKPAPNREGTSSGNQCFWMFRGERVILSKQSVGGRTSHMERLSRPQMESKTTTERSFTCRLPPLAITSFLRQDVPTRGHCHELLIMTVLQSQNG